MKKIRAGGGGLGEEARPKRSATGLHVDVASVLFLQC